MPGVRNMNVISAENCSTRGVTEMFMRPGYIRMQKRNTSAKPVVTHIYLRLLFECTYLAILVKGHFLVKYALKHLQELPI